MVDKAEREILDMIERGDLSAEDGMRLIRAMGPNQATEEPENPESSSTNPDAVPVSGEVLEAESPRISEEEMRRMKQLKRWWLLPFGIGLLITALGAIWMYTGYMNRGFSWGFWLSWIPFILGIFVVAVSFQTSRSVWLHLRINQKPGEKPERISISLPLPITLTRWFLSIFGSRVPGLKDQPIDNISEILEDISPEEPFYLQVNDDDERVEIFIG